MGLSSSCLVCHSPEARGASELEFLSENTAGGLNENGDRHLENVKVNPFTGAAFELELRLYSGNQVLNDKALRRLLNGEPEVDATQNDSLEQGGVQSGKSSGTKRMQHHKLRRSPSELSISTSNSRTSSMPYPSTSVPIGTDIPYGKPKDCHGASCHICLEAAAALPSPAKTFCVNPRCEASFCEDCFRCYVVTKVMDALHFAPPIKCPGCQHRVPTAVWSPLVDEGVHSRYLHNAKSLLTIRCPSCDNVSSLWIESDPTAAEERLLGRRIARTLSDAWRAFFLGETSADKMLSVLMPSHSTEGKISVQTRQLLAGITSLMKDDERRLSFQLAWLRRCPKICTPCCKRKMCFKCKVDGWHQGMSCEERQRSFARQELGVQPCSNCGVPTQRTEGCNHVQCVCGHSWEWEAGDTAEQGHSSVPLILACFAAPVSRGRAGAVSMLKSLLSHRADLNAVCSNNCTLVHYAAGSVETATAHKLPQSDASRLEALEQILQGSDGGSRSIDWDALDSDGDTPLALAVSELNVDAVRFLVAHGAMMRPQVLKSLRNGHQQFIPVRPAILEAIWPLLEQPERWHEDVDALNIWLEFGLADKAKTQIVSGLEVNDMIADAFVWGQCVPLAQQKNASSGGGHGIETISNLETALRDAVGAEDWECLRQSAATRMLWHTLQCSGWPSRMANAEALRIAIGNGAQINNESDEGELPIIDALERQDVVAVQELLAGGATLDPTGNGARALLLRSKGLLSPERAKPICDALAVCIKNHEIQEPLWFCLQMGFFGEAVPRWQEEEDAIDGQIVAAFIKRVLFGDCQVSSIEELLRSKLRANTWDEMKTEAASALLLQELRQSWNFERDPDVSLMRELLANHGASVNVVPADLSDELCALAMVHGTRADKHLVPLIHLARNTFCSACAAQGSVELFVEFGAEVNRGDEDGDTPLWWALRAKNISVAVALVTAGAALDEAAALELQSWVHPGSLRLLAPALAPRLAQKGAYRPAWIQVQFGLPGANEAHGDESVEELILASLLSPFCGGGDSGLDIQYQNSLGQDLWLELRKQAAEVALRGEVAGALEGEWELDSEFVEYLLEAGADPNLQLEFPSDDEDEEEEEEEEQHGEQDDEEEETESGSETTGSKST